MQDTSDEENEEDEADEEKDSEEDAEDGDNTGFDEGPPAATGFDEGLPAAATPFDEEPAAATGVVEGPAAATAFDRESSATDPPHNASDDQGSSSRRLSAQAHHEIRTAAELKRFSDDEVRLLIQVSAAACIDWSSR